ncbi:MAG TPA: hypothetical protein VHE78_10195 [Gemmatimonadaceae bacterium]|nr:hypothetical protein [Gemmatimonadaceae bacterium]
MLPRNLSTDSVFTLMLGVADALGVSCGHCHPGGDNPTWDSTNFTGDVKPTKRVAREMFRLVDRLNHELLPAAVKPGLFSVPVTCITCHRGALRPILIEDTLAIILDRQGVDSAIAEHRRIRERYRGRMTYDLSDWPLRLLASRLAARGRHREAVRVLEEDARLFPDSGEIAYQLGTAYEDDGDRQRAIMQYHKVLSLLPAHKAAQRRLRALTTEPTK